MKRIFSIILAFVLMFSTVYAEEDFLSVYDGGKIISPAVEKYILTQNILLSEETEARIIVATDSATGELTVTEYARKLYEDLGVGYIGRKNTIFLFLCEPADDYHSETLLAVYDNVFVKEFVLYEGETLNYYFEETNQEKQLMSEKAVCKKTNIVYEEGKFGRLNLISRLSKEKQYEAMVGYKQEEQVAKELFPTY